MNSRFEQNDPNWSVAKSVMNVELTFPSTPVVPQEIKDLLIGMLNKDPKKRITAEEIAGNEWLATKFAEWQRMLEYLKGTQ